MKSTKEHEKMECMAGFAVRLSDGRRDQFVIY